MKTVLYSFVLFTFFLIANPVNAQQAVLDTIVNGVVFDENGSPLSGANVDVQCNGNAQSVVTNANGRFLVVYAPELCSAGDTASAFASKDMYVGSDMGTVVVGFQNDLVRFDIVALRIDAAVVPEFGLITGSLALLGSTGAFATMRRRLS